MTAKQAELAARYGIDPIYPEDATFPPPELFPKKPAFVVREELGRRRLDIMGWGFPRKLPGKKIDKATGKPVMINTEVTNVRNYTSPFWRTAMANPEQRSADLGRSRWRAGTHAERNDIRRARPAHRPHHICRPHRREPD